MITCISDSTKKTFERKRTASLLMLVASASLLGNAAMADSKASTKAKNVKPIAADQPLQNTAMTNSSSSTTVRGATPGNELKKFPTADNPANGNEKVWGSSYNGKVWGSDANKNYNIAPTGGNPVINPSGNPPAIPSTQPPVSSQTK